MTLVVEMLWELLGCILHSIKVQGHKIGSRYTPEVGPGLPLKKCSWKTTFLLGFGNFSGATC